MSKYTFEKILGKAKKCKKNVKETGEIGINRKWSYYFCKSVQNIGKDINRISFDDCANPKGEKINDRIIKKDYISIAKKYTDFVENKNNRRLPNYSSFNSIELHPDLICYAFARILVYYDKHGKFSKTCLFNTGALSKVKVASPSKSSSGKTKKSKKYGHASKQGCDNMGQNTSYYCACHSVQEVVRNLYNIVIPQKTLARVMGTTSDGTGHEGFHTFVAWFNREYGKNLKIKEKYFSDLGVKGIKKLIDSDDSDFIIHLAYKKIYGHYENVNDIVGDTWHIQNSLGYKCDKGCYCGYKEKRDYSTQKSWINAKDGVKSVIIFTRG